MRSAFWLGESGECVWWGPNIQDKARGRSVQLPQDVGPPGSNPRRCRVPVPSDSYGVPVPSPAGPVGGMWASAHSNKGPPVAASSSSELSTCALS